MDDKEAITNSPYWQLALQLINALHTLLLQPMYHHSPNIFIQPEGQSHLAHSSKGQTH
jgi:hypothetical protein